jgi:hypothetical protein
MFGQGSILLHHLSAPDRRPADVLFRGYAGGLGGANDAGEPPRLWSRDDAVRGTPAEHLHWTTASRWYQAAICDAEAELARVTTGWLRHLPGGRLRVAQARQRHRDLTAAATAAYRPVYEEIARRLAAQEAEEFRRQEERRHERVRRLRQDQRRRRELRSRYRAVAARPVWGWTLSQHPHATMVWIFRHDVPPAGRAPAHVTRRSRERLTASGLEDALLSLYRNLRVTQLAWDSAARRRVAEETSTDHLPGSFDDWWSTATHSPWPTPTTFPTHHPAVI